MCVPDPDLDNRAIRFDDLNRALCHASDVGLTFLYLAGLTE